MSLLQTNQKLVMAFHVYAQHPAKLGWCVDMKILYKNELLLNIWFLERFL